MEANFGSASCWSRGFSARVDMDRDPPRAILLDKKEEKALAQDDDEAINKKAEVVVAWIFMVILRRNEVFC